MTWRDKMEIGIEKDAPFRRDNLPESEQDAGPAVPAGPGRSPVVPAAKDAAAQAPPATDKGERLRRPNEPPATPRRRSRKH